MSSCGLPVLLSKLCNPGREDPDSDDDAGPSLWSKQLCLHSIGQFSAASVKVNELVQEKVQVETCRRGTFIGIYDGHVDDVASRFTAEKLFPKFIRFMVEENARADPSEALLRAFASTDEEFLAMVEKGRKESPLMAAAGCCCLVALLWDGKIYVANSGRSRAVLGRMEEPTSHFKDMIAAVQLSEDHNPSDIFVRRKLISEHKDDPGIVTYNNAAWLVKGTLEATRGIGYAYLKKPGFELPPGDEYAPYQLEKPLRCPVITAEPTIQVHTIDSLDRFLILASDGLWTGLPNQKAVELVFKSPPQGVARKMVRSVLQQLTRAENVSAVVIFIDHDILHRSGQAPRNQPDSNRGFDEVLSEFAELDEDGRPNSAWRCNADLDENWLC